MEQCSEVNAAKQNSPRAAASISTARPVNSVVPKSKVNDALPKTYSYFKAHSLVKRSFNQKSAAKTNNLNEKLKTARVNNVTTVGPKVVGNPQYTLQDQGIFDSGCSMHMTGNKPFLADYQEVDGRFVAFAGSPKRSFDIKNVVPSGGLTCLFAKATIDESNLWHRRLGHINFKTMNKLVRGNLVRGLPSKLFENDHTCVACQKGKQHKASCKTKLVSSISQPLQMLHMDLFGPTSVRSINHKTYCLVVTDDYSRCDNGTEFKNNDMNQFCEMKGNASLSRIGKAKRTTEISQSSRPIHLVADETVYKEWEDIMERAATTASSLEAEQESGSGPRCQDSILGGVEAQIRFEAASKQVQ
ncbi:putative ribonuclease H-like domain-containing protein [Tanacetum coccineum]